MAIEAGAQPARLKLVVRNLPPSLTSSEFSEAVKKACNGKCTWSEFYPGTVSSPKHATSRGYLQLRTEEDVLAFSKAFQGHSFVDSRGRPYAAQVEYAPFQQVPKDSVEDPRAGTIEEDEDYRSFVAKLEEGVKLLPAAEQVMQSQRSATTTAGAAAAGKAAAADGPVLTALMQHMMTAKASEKRPRGKAAQRKPLFTITEVPLSQLDAARDGAGGVKAKPQKPAIKDAKKAAAAAVAAKPAAQPQPAAHHGRNLDTHVLRAADSAAASAAAQATKDLKANSTTRSVVEHDGSLQRAKAAKEDRADRDAEPAPIAEKPAAEASDASAAEEQKAAQESAAQAVRQRKEVKVRAGFQVWTPRVRQTGRSVLEATDASAEAGTALTDVPAKTESAVPTTTSTQDNDERSKEQPQDTQSSKRGVNYLIVKRPAPRSQAAPSAAKESLATSHAAAQDEAGKDHAPVKQGSVDLHQEAAIAAQTALAVLGQSGGDAAAAAALPGDKKRGPRSRGHRKHAAHTGADKTTADIGEQKGDQADKPASAAHVEADNPDTETAGHRNDDATHGRPPARGGGGRRYGDGRASHRGATKVLYVPVRTLKQGDVAAADAASHNEVSMAASDDAPPSHPQRQSAQGDAQVPTNAVVVVSSDSAAAATVNATTPAAAATAADTNAVTKSASQAAISMAAATAAAAEAQGGEDVGASKPARPKGGRRYSARHKAGGEAAAG